MNCHYRKWSKGYKQRKDNNVPEWMWGQYYPGDEPHWECLLTEEECDLDSCPLGQMEDE